jgi:hypothetical protein
MAKKTNFTMLLLLLDTPLDPDTSTNRFLEVVENKAISKNRGIYSDTSTNTPIFRGATNRLVLSFTGEAAFVSFGFKSSSTSRAKTVLVNRLLKQLLLICKILKYL